MQKLFDVKLATKIAGGFGMLLVLLAVISCAGLFSLSTLVNIWGMADNADQVVKAVLEARRHEKNYIIRGDMSYVKKVDDLVVDFRKRAEQSRGRAETQAEKDEMTRGIQEIDKYLAAFHKYGELKRQQDGASDAATKAALVDPMKAVDQDMINAARGAQDVFDKARVRYKDAMDKNIQLARKIIISVSGLALLMGVFLTFILTRAITKPLKVIIEGLSTGAEQVTAAAAHISAAGQHLADGASQQAAAVEQTSSSLEEMASMTKQNAENAKQANMLMTETKQTVGDAGESMNKLMSSMAEISSASEETSKIIKTIDEIAFQTNLLALNAAVEAARAGEAGAGFAVVADEVRNLAIRAAEAAKSTAELIQTTVYKINEGSTLVGKTSDDFTRVTSGAVKMAELVDEITAASGEQAQGIDQISKAVNDMDKVIQSNAADAEESASASEEMSGQAQQMKSFVVDLEYMVGGAKQGTNGKKKVLSAASEKAVWTAAKSGLKISRKSSVPSHAAGKANGGGNGAHAPSTRKPTTAEQVIPFEDKEFDF